MLGYIKTFVPCGPLGHGATSVHRKVSLRTAGFSTSSFCSGSFVDRWRGHALEMLSGLPPIHNSRLTSVPDF